MVDRKSSGKSFGKKGSKGGNKVVPQGIFEVFTDARRGMRLYTKSLLGTKFSEFGEKHVKDVDGTVYREWDPKRSKLAAFIKNGCVNTGIRSGSVVLYLGASHGHTPSYVSDMVGEEGFVFALDFAPRVVRDLVFICERRSNMTPILGDAMHPETYADRVSEVDMVFMDIAQREQAKIFLRNVRMFLKDGGIGLLAVKARSISIKGSAKEICEEVRDQIGEEYMVTEFRSLEPHEVDHYMIAIKKKAPAVNPNASKKKEGGPSKKSSDRRSNRSSSHGAKSGASKNRGPQSKARSSGFRSFEKKKRK